VALYNITNFIIILQNYKYYHAVERTKIENGLLEDGEAA